MISSFKYLSPVQEAYSKVMEAETTVNAAIEPNVDSQPNQEAKELLDSKKGNPYSMSDEERRLFYQGEIKRLRRLEKYYEQQRKYSTRNVAPTGGAAYALRNTIEKYQRELENMNQNDKNQNDKNQNNQKDNQNINQTPFPFPSPSSQQSF